jgi:hypothetical protein
MSGKSNKFGFLKSARQSEEAAADEEMPSPEGSSAAEEVTPSPALSVHQSEDPSAKSKTKHHPPAPEPTRRVGRPSGKRSDGEHVQVTAYIRRETHLAAKTFLLQEQKGRDFSELVEELLAKWLRSPT